MTDLLAIALLDKCGLRVLAYPEGEERIIVEQADGTGQPFKITLKKALERTKFMECE